MIPNSIRSFVVGLFAGRISSQVQSSLPEIEQAARDDARLVVGTYLDAFEQEAASMLADRQRKLIGCEDVLPVPAGKPVKVVSVKPVPASGRKAR